jgi:hypothetical protein
VQTERVGAPAPRGIKIRLPLSSEGRVGAMEKGPAAHPRRGPRKTALCFSESSQGLLGQSAHPSCSRAGSERRILSHLSRSSQGRFWPAVECGGSQIGLKRVASRKPSGQSLADPHSCSHVVAPQSCRVICDETGSTRSIIKCLLRGAEPSAHCRGRCGCVATPDSFLSFLPGSSPTIACRS